MIRPDGPVPTISEISTDSSRASFLVAGEALTFGRPGIKESVSWLEAFVSDGFEFSSASALFSAEMSEESLIRSSSISLEFPRL